MEKARDLRFDNLKAVLIFSVVLGHYLFPYLSVSMALKKLCFFIYLYHMPVFVWVSGRFARFGLKRTLKRFVYPYLIFQTILFLVRHYVMGWELEVGYLTPQLFMWYLFNLAIWSLTLPLLDRVPGRKGRIALVATLFALALAAGFWDALGERAGLSRLIVFYPFYVMGYYGKDQAYHVPKPAVIALGLGTAVIALLLLRWRGSLILTWTYGSYSYRADGYPMLYRLCFFLTAFVMGGFLLAVLPNKRRWYTYVGENSLPVYLTHVLLCYVLLMKPGLYELFSSTAGRLVFVLAASAAVTLVMARPRVTRVLGPLTGWPLELTKK